MASWDAARSGGAASSSSRDTVSPLTLKLQQVWLQTQMQPQMRNSNRNLNAPTTTEPVGVGSNGVGPGGGEGAAPATSPVAISATTPSSSSESGDDSWGVVDSSKRRILQGNEDALLQYIDDMLNEDHIESQACLDMAVGVGAYEAELAELIQASSPGNSSERGEGSPSTSSPSFTSSNPVSVVEKEASSSSQQTNHRSKSHQSKSHQARKRGLPPVEEAKSFQLITRVSFLERQGIFDLIQSRNGTGSGSNRPPRLLLQTLPMSENYTALWERMGLDSHLMNKLVACGEAVSCADLNTAWALVEELRYHAAGREGNATQRVVFYFLEALIARMHGTGERMFNVMCKSRPSIGENLKAVQMIHKYTPFLGLPHFFTNRIILEAIRGHKKLHIVDFGIMYGLQWPILFSMLAERKEGIPHVRITGIDLPPRVSNHDGRIRDTGVRLKNCAQVYGIPFRFKSVAKPWQSVEPADLQLKDDEVLVVCCFFKQTNLFDETIIAESPKNQWLTKIRNLNPKVFIQCLASSDFGNLMFLRRFQNAVIHHAAIFAAMDACISRMMPDRIVIEQDKYGREIMNIIACEMEHRVERSETHQQWHQRAVKAGFEILPLGQHLFEESKHFAKAYNKELTVDKEGDWMWLGWHDQIIHAYSAWKPGL